MSNDEALGPLAELLAQHQPTQLDDFLGRKQQNNHAGASTPNSKQNDPIIVLDPHSPDEEVNIGLQFRQPSFSSLQEQGLRTKGGDTQIEIPEDKEDPVIVFDTHSSEPDDLPITLSVRQPSFVSLSKDPIPKGSDSLAEFEPVIEEVTPLPTAGLEEIADDEDVDDDDPQVQIVKDLKVKNQDRWKQMGYEPPLNLIPLARAASQATMNNIGSNGLLAPSRSCNSDANAVSGQPKFQTLVPAIEEIPENQSPQNASNKPAQPTETVPLKKKRMVIEPIHENDEEECQNEQPIDNDEEEEQIELLFGHLPQIVPQTEDKLVIRTLRTGVINLVAGNFAFLRKQFKKYLDICTEHIWIEETSFLNELISMLGDNNIKKRNMGFKRPNGQEDIKKLKQQRKDIDKQFDEKIEEVKEKQRQAIAELNEQYKLSAEKIDQKYQDPAFIEQFGKPSKNLLDMRSRARTMLKLNDIAGASRLTERIAQLEDQEKKRKNRELRNKYYTEDRKMKETFAKKREIISRKYDYKIERIETERAAALNAVKNAISKIKIEMENIGEETTPEDYQSHEQNYPACETEFLEKGRFELEIPKKINRQNDFEILECLSSQIREGVAPHNVDIESAFREIQKTQT